MVSTVSTEIKNFGILGYPVGHSLSPQMYTASFKAAGLKNYNYILKRCILIPKYHLRTLPFFKQVKNLSGMVAEETIFKIR